MNRKVFLLYVGSLVCLFLVGTVWDAPIAAALYNPASALGWVGEWYGNTLPLALAISFSMFAFMRCFNRGHRVRSTLLTIVCSLPVVIFTAMAAVVPLYYAGQMDNFLWLGLNLLAIGGLVALLGRATLRVPQSKKQTLWRLGWVVLLAVQVANGLVEVIKPIFARPRVYMVVQELAEYAPWYAAGTGSGDAFKSFPSGHASGAATLFFIALLPLVFEGLKKYEGFLYTIAIGFAGFVMLARMMMGAHHLADVTAGALITMACYGIFIRIFLVGKGKQTTLQGGKQYA